MTTPHPISAARRWAKDHPGQTAFLRVIRTVTVGGVFRHNRLGKERGYEGHPHTRRSYYLVQNGRATPVDGSTELAEVSPADRPAYPIFTLDLRPSAPRIEPKVHDLYWALLSRTAERAPCPACGAPDLETRRDGRSLYVRHCGALHPLPPADSLPIPAISPTLAPAGGALPLSGD